MHTTTRDEPVQIAAFIVYIFKFLYTSIKWILEYFLQEYEI